MSHSTHRTGDFGDESFQVINFTNSKNKTHSNETQMKKTPHNKKKLKLCKLVLVKKMVRHDPGTIADQFQQIRDDNCNCFPVILVTKLQTKNKETQASKISSSPTIAMTG